ncbi:MAG: amidohydrolase family protein, partial [Burkholderiales bacterium]
ASSFSPNHSGWGGRPMPSTIASDREIDALVGVLGDAGRGVFMMATGSRVTPEIMEGFAARTRRPMFISTVLTMYNPAFPERALNYYDRCLAALARGREVYIQASCQPLCFDFSLRDPYLLYSHDAFERVKSDGGTALEAIYADPAFRAAFRANLANPKTGILFYGHWGQVEVGATEHVAARTLEGRTITAIAAERGIDPLDAFFDVALEAGLDTVFVAKLFQAIDDGVEPLLKHRAGVVTLSDAGAHLKFMCDAGFGLHFLGHWVRERAAFTLAEGVRRLTSDPALKYRIPERGQIRRGYWADVVLFDPATVGISETERVSDFPGGTSRMIRRAKGIHGVWVNGVKVHDGREYVAHLRGPGRVLDHFAS